MSNFPRLREKGEVGGGDGNIYLYILPPGVGYLEMCCIILIAVCVNVTLYNMFSAQIE